MTDASGAWHRNSLKASSAIHTATGTNPLSSDIGRWISSLLVQNLFSLHLFPEC